MAAKKLRTPAKPKGSARAPLHVDDPEVKAALSAVSKKYGASLAEVLRRDDWREEAFAIYRGGANDDGDVVPVPWVVDGATLPFTAFAETLLEVTFTPAQRVLSRVVYDGADPIDLDTPDERAVALEMFKCERIPAAARALFVVLRLGRGSGKTTICGAYAVYRMCVADVSRCGPGDKPAVIVIAPDAKIAAESIARGQAFADAPAIKGFVTRTTQEGFELRRPQDGKVVRLIVRARSRRAGRGFSPIEVIIDESEYVSSSSREGIINDKDVIDSVVPRLEPGGRVTLVSTPWPAPSQTSEMFAENYGAPASAICALASTPVMRDYDPHMMSMIEKLKVSRPSMVQQEYFCVLEDGAGGAFFEMSTVRAATEGPTIVAAKERASCGIDPAFVHDSSAIAVVERSVHPRGGWLLTLVHLDMLTPTRERPLVPSEVIRDFAATARLYGCSILATDSHKVATVRAHAAVVGVQVFDRGEPKACMVYLREVLRDGRLRIPNDERLIAQLKGFTYRAMTGGDIKIESPRSSETGHGDLVSALAQAVYLDSVQFGAVVVGEGVAARSRPSTSTEAASFGGGLAAAPSGARTLAATASGPATPSAGPRAHRGGWGGW